MINMVANDHIGTVCREENATNLLFIVLAFHREKIGNSALLSHGLYCR